jgi:hypothetical protein
MNTHPIASGRVASAEPGIGAAFEMARGAKRKTSKKKASRKKKTASRPPDPPQERPPNPKPNWRGKT